ncbi:hypothetical protein AB0F46_01785 [Streptomyces sp. NPDC026665]|uniref:hypothetical protein n=1 Tax=Streptomyces sp. NPDC026665 TaxID=3154798 RepID=UPI0033F125DC
MTPSQIFLIAALGGIAGVVGLFIGLALSVALVLLALKIGERLSELPEAWRNRRQQLAQRRDLDACMAIAALPAHNPGEGHQ